MTVDIHDVDYHTRTGAHLIQKALSWGWDTTDGEGAFEYVTRQVYERAIEDLLDGHHLALSHKIKYLLTKTKQEEQP